MWEAFEQQATYQCVKDTSACIEKVLEKLNQPDPQSDLINNIYIGLEGTLGEFKKFMTNLKQYPTASLWIEFLEMCDILFRFVFCQREGNWEGHLCEAALMLPYLTAAGHYKYGQQSLPIYIQEMRNLETEVPEVHAALKKGHLWAGEPKDTITLFPLICF